VFRLEFETDNDAFVEDAHGEIARILAGLAMDFTNGVPAPGVGGGIRDVNGNTVGKWQYTPGEDQSWDPVSGY
jgi:hypothetical protein